MEQLNSYDFKKPLGYNNSVILLVWRFSIILTHDITCELSVKFPIT